MLQAERGWSCLHCASHEEHVSVVQHLVGEGGRELMMLPDETGGLLLTWGHR